MKVAICFVRFGIGVPELCLFLKLFYPYRKSLYLKLLQQFSSHLNDFSWFSLFPLTKLRQGIYSSVIGLYLIAIMINIYSNINVSVHITCSSSRLWIELQIITITVQFHKHKSKLFFWVKFCVAFFFHLTWVAAFIHRKLMHHITYRRLCF